MKLAINRTDAALQDRLLNEHDLDEEPLEFFVSNTPVRPKTIAWKGPEAIYTSDLMLLRGGKEMDPCQASALMDFFARHLQGTLVHNNTSTYAVLPEERPPVPTRIWGLYLVPKVSRTWRTISFAQFRSGRQDKEVIEIGPPHANPDPTQPQETVMEGVNPLHWVGCIFEGDRLTFIDPGNLAAPTVLAHFRRLYENIVVLHPPAALEDSEDCGPVAIACLFLVSKFGAQEFQRARFEDSTTLHNFCVDNLLRAVSF